MSNVNASIKLGSGFLLKNAPVDLKTTAATLAERNSYVDDGILYKGAEVYVEENDTKYRYTGVAPTDDDYSACFVDVNAGTTELGNEVVKLTGDQTIAGTKTFSTAPKIDTKTVTTVEDVNALIGDTVQAHNDNLDAVAGLATDGIVIRNADGTFKAENVGTAGTYTKVTTDAQGRVTAGENPTTLAGYGITDAVKKSGDTVTGVINYSGIDSAVLTENSLTPKSYVDSAALGFTPHPAVQTAAIENVDGTYAAGSNTSYPGVGATFTTSVTSIGGVTLIADQRVLLTAQTDAKQNGAYVVTAVSTDAGATTITLTRADDMDGDPVVPYKGACFLIAEGTLKGNVFSVENTGNIVFGTDEINFVQTFTPNAYKSGAGVSVENNTVSLVAGDTVQVIGGKVEVASGTGNTGKVLVAGADGAAAAWGTVSLESMAPDAVKGDLMYFDGTKWTRLAKGGANTLLGVDADGNVTYLTKLSAGTF